MKKYIVGVIVLVVTISCNNNTKAPLSEQQEIRIENLQANLLESKIDNIEFIKLDKSDKRSFVKNIDKLIVDDSSVYLLDFLGTRSLSLYALNGDFIGRIGRLGSGPGEYTTITDFDVDTMGNVWLYDSQRKNMLKYSNENKYLSTTKVPFFADGFSLLKNGDFIFTLQRELGKPQVVVCDSLMTIKKEFLVYDKIDMNNKLDKSIFNKYKNEYIAYNRGVNDTLHLFSAGNGEHLKAYYINFLNSSVPDELRGDYEKLTGERRVNNFRYFHQSPIVFGDFIVGNIFEGRNKSLLFIDIENNAVSSTPLISGEIKYDLPNLPLYVTKDNKIVSYIDFEIYNASDKSVAIADEYKSHLEEGGIILTLSKIKD